MDRDAHLFRSVFEHAGIGILVLNRQGVIQRANPSAGRMLGYDDPGDLAGKHFVDITHPDDREASRAQTASMLAANGDQPLRMEKRYIRRDGSMMHGHVVVSATAAETDMLIAQVEDITDARTRDELNRRLLESIPGGVVWVRADGAIQHANREACRILGLTLDELSKRYVVDFETETVYEDGRPCPVQDYPVSRCLMTGEPQPPMTIGVRRPDTGQLSWAVFRAVPFNDPMTGDPTGSVVTILDITQRMRTERALETSEARYRQIVETATEGIAIVTPDLKFRFVNEHFARMLDRNAEELIGLDAMAFAEAPTRRIHELETAVRDRALVFELTLRNDKRGAVRVVASTSPIFSPTGELEGVLGMVTDVTRMRRLEEALHEAEKMEAIGQLAGGIAHDFNNQLTGILGFAELLRERVTDPDLREYVRTIIASAHRAADLTAQMLAFARRGKFRNEIVDLHSVIDDVVALVTRGSAAHNRIRVTRDLQADSALTTGDPTQLHNALLNVALNACDAMPDGGDLAFATSVCEFAPDDERRQSGGDMLPAGPYVQLEVRDSGAGIEADTLRHIFEPFFTTKGDQGTGMGLAATYGTIRNHRGLIEVRSTPGEGSVFVIYLPLAADTRSDSSRRVGVQPVPGSARILVVDDEETVRELASRSLQPLGYDVKCVADGRAALDELHAQAGVHPYDLVLLDMAMPGMSGIECFQQLRTMTPPPAVVLMSGYSMDGDAQAALDSGDATFVQKPFTIAQLSHVLSTALERDPTDVG